MPQNLLDISASSLMASLIWGSVGFGFCIYGKKQGVLTPFFGGMIMIALSYLVDSALYMTLDCLGVIAVIAWLNGRL